MNRPQICQTQLLSNTAASSVNSDCVMLHQAEHCRKATCARASATPTARALALATPRRARRHRHAAQLTARVKQIHSSADAARMLCACAATAVPTDAFRRSARRRPDHLARERANPARASRQPAAKRSRGRLTASTPRVTRPVANAIARPLARASGQPGPWRITTMKRALRCRRAGGFNHTSIRRDWRLCRVLVTCIAAVSHAAPASRRCSAQCGNES